MNDKTKTIKPGSNTLFHGAAYYPEAWDWEDISADIERMRKAGLNAVRVFEFAWSEMEPREGEFHFKRFKAVIKALHAADISVVLGTPTAAPPAWLTLNHPETMTVNSDGSLHGHGARRHYCPNSPLFREKTRIICEKMAEELGTEPGVIAWQTDNEISAQECAARRGGQSHVGCFCRTCKELFRESLKAEYGSIAELNRQWGTNIWSQRYDSFEQIEPPAMACGCAAHPSLVYAWNRFSNTSYVEYQKIHIAAIRGRSPLPITHNAMPFFHLMDYDALFADLDFASNDFYGLHTDMPVVMLKELDWMRPVSKRRFWVMETSANWAGGTAAAYPAHPPGFVRAKAWTHIAAGGEATLYWLFRGHWSGQESLHGSVYHHFGAPAPCFEDISAHSAEIQKPEVRDFVVGTYPAQPQVALHYSARSQWVMRNERFVREFDNYQWEYSRGFYLPLLKAGLLRDIVFESSDVSAYRLVFTPLMPILTPALFEKMRRFAESGGTWVAGPVTDLRTVHNTWPRKSATANLEAWSGARVARMFPARGAGATVALPDGRLNGIDGWALAFEDNPGHEVLARYASGPTAGMPAIVSVAAGKGRLVLAGVALRGDGEHETGHWSDFCAKLAADAGVTARTDCQWGTIMYPRTGPAGEGAIAVNWSGEPTTARLARAGRELLSGQETGAEIQLAPFGVAVVRYITSVHGSQFTVQG